MTSKTIKPSDAERKIKRLKANLKSHKELHAALKRQHTDYRLHASKTLADHLFKVRRAEETLASNNMTIQELNDQVAMQWKQRAEARSDVERANNLAAEATSRHNRMVTYLQESREGEQELARTVDLLRSKIEILGEEIAEAKRSLAYRIYRLADEMATRCAISFRGFKQQLWNRWLVWRLNKPRVQAMSEAGYIPSKLIKMAEEYWETDKRRMGETITNYSTYPADEQYVSRQTLWRRLRIWMGRA